VKFKVAVLFISLLMSLVTHSSNKAQAYFQGQEVNNSGFTVAITSPQRILLPPICTGALFGERIVITAKRCLLVSGGSLQSPLESFDVYAPDADVSKSKPAAKIIQYFAPVGNLKSLFPDIIFLVLDKKIGNSPIEELLTYEKGKNLSNILSNIEVFGYGISDEIYKEPIWKLPKKVAARLDFRKEPYENQTDYFRFSPFLCEGDTGGPIVTTIDGKLVLIGIARASQIIYDSLCDGKDVAYSANGIQSSPKISFATPAGEYKSVFDQALVLATELNKKEQAAEELRAKQEAETKAAEELRAKQEAEAAAALKAKQEADARAAAAKKTTITCLKGKISKKVTGIKPKCPSGYKVKK
jgi:hypothetical protein